MQKTDALMIFPTRLLMGERKSGSWDAYRTAILPSLGGGYRDEEPTVENLRFNEILNLGGGGAGGAFITVKTTMQSLCYLNLPQLCQGTLYHPSVPMKDHGGSPHSP